MTEATSTAATGAGSESHRPRRRPGAESRSAPVPDRSRSYRHLINPFAPLRVFSDDQVAAIHEAALTILENHGMRVLLPEAREAYRRAGATVDESTFNVRLDRGLVTGSLAKANNVKAFLEPQIRSAADKHFEATYTVVFAKPLPTHTADAERLSGDLTRYGSGEAYVEATATAPETGT